MYSIHILSEVSHFKNTDVESASKELYFSRMRMTDHDVVITNASYHIEMTPIMKILYYFATDRMSSDSRQMWRMLIINIKNNIKCFPGTRQSFYEQPECGIKSSIQNPSRWQK